MPQLKLGLAARDGSYYDPKTNVYITPTNPVETISYDNNTDLSGLAHAVFAHQPALILHEGKFPQTTVDAWKAKYERGVKPAQDRADQIQAAAPATVTGTAKHASGAAKDVAPPITAQEVGEAKEELIQDELLADELLADEPVESDEPKKGRKK